MPGIWKELRYSARMLARNPAVSAVCITTLALGIGANTTIFSVVNSIFLKPLPVPDPQQIVVLALRQKAGPLAETFSVPELRDLRKETASAFSELIGEQLGLDGFKFEGKADRVVSSYVTGNFFSGLRLRPAAGQLIQPDQGEIAGADAFLVLSYKYWRTRFAGDPDIVGRKALVDGRPFTILGVAPEGFHGVHSLIDTQVYLPLAMAVIEGYPETFIENRSVRNIYICARLRPGVTLAQGQAALAVSARRISQQNPETEKDFMPELFPERLARPSPDPENTILVIATLFLALSALVLLIACVNVTNILLVRATVRRREAAIRVALGASRQALMRQVLIESLLLSIGGGLAGVLLGYWGSVSLSSLHIGTDLPVLLDFGFDWRVFGYAFLGAICAGTTVGLVPALGAAKADLNQMIHTGARGSIGGSRNRLRSFLVTAQVAGSLTLLITAGLFAGSLAKVQHIQLGFDPNHVVNFSMDPTEIGYNEAQGRLFFHELLRRVEASPAVQSASLANTVPLGYYNNSDPVLLPARKDTQSRASDTLTYNVVTPGYFRTMGISLLSGRSFTNADDQNAAYTAVISDAMAKHFWPKQQVIGKEFRLASDPAHNIKVVGVVSDVRFANLTGPIRPFFYLPLWQHYASNSLATLQVRTLQKENAAIPEIERIMHGLAPDLPIFDVKSMTQALYTINGLLMFQVGAGLAGALGLVGLVLAVVGVYGVISYVTAQRTHEIGLRMALGARPANILELVFKHGLLTIGLGVVIGLAITLSAAGLIGQLVIISPTDPAIYIAVTGLLTAVALCACYIPARRAMRVDPMAALRHD